MLDQNLKLSYPCWKSTQPFSPCLSQWVFTHLLISFSLHFLMSEISPFSVPPPQTIYTPLPKTRHLFPLCLEGFRLSCVHSIPQNNPTFPIYLSSSSANPYLNPFPRLFFTWLLTMPWVKNQAPKDAYSLDHFSVVVMTCSPVHLFIELTAPGRWSGWGFSCISSSFALLSGWISIHPSLVQGGPEPQTFGGEKEQPSDHLHPPQYGE